MLGIRNMLRTPIGGIPVGVRLGRWNSDEKRAAKRHVSWRASGVVAPYRRISIRQLLAAEIWASYLFRQTQHRGDRLTIAQYLYTVICKDNYHTKPWPLRPFVLPLKHSGRPPYVRALTGDPLGLL